MIDRYPVRKNLDLRVPCKTLSGVGAETGVRSSELGRGARARALGPTGPARRGGGLRRRAFPIKSTIEAHRGHGGGGGLRTGVGLESGPELAPD